MKKQKLFTTQNIMTSLKAFVVSLLTMLILVIPIGIGYYLATKQMVMLSWVFNLVALAGNLFVWGWLANKFWKWK